MQAVPVSALAVLHIEALQAVYEVWVHVFCSTTKLRDSHVKAMLLCRGEYVAERLALERAVKEAYDKGFLGKNACGSGVDFDVMVTFGAGAYICGASFSHNWFLQLQILFMVFKH